MKNDSLFSSSRLRILRRMYLNSQDLYLKMMRLAFYSETVIWLVGIVWFYLPLLFSLVQESQRDKVKERLEKCTRDMLKQLCSVFDISVAHAFYGMKKVVSLCIILLLIE
jgi:hypothetical protein